MKEPDWWDEVLKNHVPNNFLSNQPNKLSTMSKDLLKEAYKTITSDYLTNAQVAIGVELGKKDIRITYIAKRLEVDRTTCYRYIANIGTMPVSKFFTLLTVLGLNPWTLKPNK